MRVPGGVTWRGEFYGPEQSFVTKSSQSSPLQTALQPAAHAEFAAVVPAAYGDDDVVVVDLEALHFHDGIADFHVRTFAGADGLVVNKREASGSTRRD